MNDVGDSSSILAPQEAERKQHQADVSYRVGDWYWVPHDEDDAETGTDKWLGCIIHLGSNFAMFAGPINEHSSYHKRVHFDDMDKCLYEPEPVKIIAEKVAEQRRVISEAVKQISSLISRLAIGERAPNNETQALAVFNGASMDEYKQDLLAAKDKALPDLFNVIKEASRVMRTWLSAEMLPLKGSSSQLSSAIQTIENRIFGVQLYAGLIEQVKEIKSGAPAAINEPVHLFQRRHYMDEECLVAYEAGGMSFEHLADFEAWLLRPANLSRLFPYPRSVVAFRVRRTKKEFDGDIADFVRMMFDCEDDKDLLTYLYLKNGEQFFRLETGIDFGEKLFPDIEHSVLQSGKVYGIMDYSKVQRLGTEGEYLDTLRREAEEKIEYEQVPKKEQWYWHSKIREPSSQWTLWDQKTVYYDDISAFVKTQMEAHNRLVLVLQGLFDRSTVFAPHPPYKLWSQDDFTRAFVLVYDDSRALTAGDKPNFLAYQEQINRGLRPGALTVGQDDYWTRREAVKYNSQIDREYGPDKGYYLYKTKYRPRDDAGPGMFTTVAKVSFGARGKSCSFTWEHLKKKQDRWGREVSDQVVIRKLSVPKSELLCVDTYKPGDYHRFFDDPRTRSEYLKWAPLLLRAEEWYQNHQVKNVKG
jgi:hypothetical protein